MDEAALVEWILDAGLEGLEDAAVLDGLCERLVAAGMPLWRATYGSDVLDPTLDARGSRWVRGQPVEETQFTRAENFDDDPGWQRSPFYRLIVTRESFLRRRLDAPDYVEGEFPLLDEFRAKGATDYVALSVTWSAADRLGDMDGMVASFTADGSDGFTAAQIGLLQRIIRPFALVVRLRATRRAATTLLETYLGHDAARRVLAGNIVRGQAETIRAVVWYSDLVGFTRIADQLGRDGVLVLLNDYAEAQVEAIEAHGGHVLKFVGDGVLAIFPGDDPEMACLAALDAAEACREKLFAVNARRAAADQPITEIHLALHVGELLYGNFGGPRRLDFTVLGPAVNEASRIEALCGSLEQRVIVSTAFAEAAGPRAHNRLVSLGRYAMKGVGRPQELFTLDPA